MRTFQQVVQQGNLVALEGVKAAHNSLRSHLQAGDGARYRHLHTSHAHMRRSATAQRACHLLGRANMVTVVE